VIARDPIFVILANGTHYALVGDIVWQLAGITEREEFPWITRRRADTDVKANRENLLRMIALKERRLVVRQCTVKVFS
jgi:hypothetical protein